MSGAVPPLPLYVFMGWTGKTFKYLASCVCVGEMDVFDSGNGDPSYELLVPNNACSFTLSDWFTSYLNVGLSKHNIGNICVR
jgi:hypothetical protein